MGEALSYNNRFKFVLENDEYKASKFEFMITGFTVPGMSLGFIEQETPIRPIFIPGNEITFDELVINFTVDENWLAWIEIFDWIKAIKSTTEIDENIVYRNASLILLDTKSRPLKSIDFKDIFPMNLAPVDKNIDMESLAPDICSITFKINDMTINTSL
jgi:hypothetical protein